MKPFPKKRLKISLRGALADEYEQDSCGLIEFINRKRLKKQVDRHQEGDLLIVYKKSENHMFCEQGLSKREWMGKEIRG